MAKEEKLEVEEDAKKGKGLLFIIIGAVAGGIIAGVIITWLLLGDSSEEGVVASEAEPEVAQTLYFKYEKPFLVNFHSKNVQRYLQVGLTFKGKSQKAMDLLEQHEPVVKNRLNQLLGSQEMAVLQTDAGRQGLVKEITQLIQDFLKEHDDSATIDTVLFTSFVMQ